MSTSAPGTEIAIAAAADLHGELPQVAPCDLLLLAGDIVPYSVERDPLATAEWFATTFTEWLESTPAAEVVAVAGNHDFWAPEIPAGVHERLFGARWTYLRDAEITTRCGLRVYGTPWTRDVYGTAFEASAPELERIWSQIPQGLDVLLTHCPPEGHGDHLGGGESGELELMGAPELVGAITATRPRLVLFGHAHEAYGYRAESPPGSLLANVSVRTDYTGGLHHPSEFRLVTG